MTTALPAQAASSDSPLTDTHRLRLVGDTAYTGDEGNGSAPLVGYLVLVPQGTDPAQLFAEDVTRPDIRPVACTAVPPVQQAEARDGVVRVDPTRRLAEQLMADIWGYEHIGDGRTVDVHIARLRRKLGTAHRHRIVTVRRVGYKYVPEQPESSRTAPCHRP
ncbi:winged helix-turn-helix domain-containing protein [Streptomyces sp. CA-251251]|uniref:winged helix-turn-helix domain-containing protein n=1 Tax=Streptomyces sp. CA-251251 TaxID=3240063 RepID=UPI003D9261AC